MREEITVELEDIRYEVDGGVARITLNRPEVMNAFSPQTLKELEQAFRLAWEDKRVGVVVLTGAGQRAFCAGGDVNYETPHHFEADDPFDIEPTYRALRRCLKPVIARVNGYAIGGGHHLAYMCDFTIASEDAVFGQNGPRVASPADDWFVPYLRTVVGMKRAKEIWMLARRFNARQAYEWGLVNAVVPADQLDAEVARWCDELLALSPTVLKALKKAFDDSVSHIRERHSRFEIIREINPDFFTSGEQAEGARAFLEKRKPDFSPWR